MIEVKQGEHRIRITRDAQTLASAPAAEPMALAAVTDAPSVLPGPEPVPVPAGETLRAPIVGTAYLASHSGGMTFARVGERVSVGDTLLVIEAMKVRNPVVARRAGTIVEVLVDDGWPVEYDQPLIIIA